MRLDLYLVENGIIKSRERAKEHIKNGEVKVNDKVVTKAAYDTSADDKIEFIGTALQYVGRGGLKLEKAIKCFKLDLNGKACLDIGASTGGFTDCMLKNGASKVYAVDVGHGQLDESLVSDDRVINMEKTNIVNTDISDFEPAPDFISCDVSFVSLKTILPKAAEFLRKNQEAVFLIKPQFEAGKSNIGKNGIVKDRKVHINVLNDLIIFCNDIGLSIIDLDFSPISGGDGNIEYLAHIVHKTEKTIFFDTKKLVNDAFEKLK